MISIESPPATGRMPVIDALQKTLHGRMDELLGSLNHLTKRRDAGELTLQDSLPIELALVVELGQVQDRLRLMGCHSYDGCRECRPLSWNPPSIKKEDDHVH